MSLSRIIGSRNAILASSAPLTEKLSRIDELVRATAVLALLSNDVKVRHVFDELLDLYITLSNDVLSPATNGAGSTAFVNRQAVVHDRTRRMMPVRSRRTPTHLSSV
jgi:hypothetical protein